MKQKRPVTGVIVIVMKDKKVLIGRRLGNVAASGEFGVPGGHLEYGESFAECAHREVMEETGMEIEEPNYLGVSNIRHYPDAHLVMILMRAEWKSGEPERREPDRCEGWDWYDLDAVPEPMTIATRDAITALLKKETVFDEEITSSVRRPVLRRA